MNLRTIILTSLILLFCYLDAKSQDCVFTLRTVTTSSTCFANGTVKVIAEGADVDAGLLSLDTAQYKIQELGGQGHSTGFAKNNGEFYDLHKGNYIVTMRVFCKKNGISVDKQTATFTITGDYVAPNMYVDLANTIKTLSCINTGRLAIYVNYGKAPYTAKILRAPPEYTGDTVFSTSTTGLSYIENLPAGTYYLELRDDCGNTFITSGTIATLSTDFINYAINYTYKYLDNCKSLRAPFTEIASTHELYYYATNFAKFYDIFLQEDNEARVEMPGARKVGTSFYFELDKLTYADLYPASTTLAKGGSIAKLYFKVKGCNIYSNPIYLPVQRPYPFFNIMPTCAGAVVKVSQSENEYGLICYPYKVEIKDATSHALISSIENIPNSKLREIATLPYGTYSYIVFTGADGGQWTSAVHTPNSPLPVYNNNKPKAIIKQTINSVCTENLHTGNIYIYLQNEISSKSMIPGTQVKSLEVPPGMQKAPDTVLTSTAYYYPYGESNIILPGVYKYEVSVPCIGLKDTVSVTFGTIDAWYRQIIRNNSCADYLGKLHGHIYAGAKSTDKIPGGTTFTYMGSTPNSPAHDAAVVYPNFVMPSDISRVFNPFFPDYTSTSGYADIPAGVYKFEIHDAYCNQTKEISLAMNTAYTLESFDYTIDTLCDGIKIYPVGQIKSAGNNSDTYFEITKAVNENGEIMPASEYPTHTISKSEFFTLQRNGIYTLAIKNKIATGVCASGTLTIHYRQPSPSLNYKLTASFVCKGAALGDLAFIKLVGVGGYGNGPYEYEILGAVPEQKNTTGEFTYGEANDVLKIRITDKSPEATAKGCIAYIEQNVTVLDLSEASIAYSENNGNFCEGETIKLNCVSLGNTTYNWTGPNGYTSTDQFPDIPNATVGMSGYYYVNVKPQSCGDIMKDSVLITVHPNPVLPTITNPNLYVCYNTGNCDLTALSGVAITAAGNSLKWYDANGLPLASTLVSSVIQGVSVYYVCQVVDATLCEGPRVAVTLEVKARPISPVVPSPAAVCYGDNFTICVTNADVANKYRLYPSTSGGTVLNEKQGTASPTLCFDPMQYNVSSAALTMYVAAVNQFGCESTPRSTVTTQRAPTAVAANVLINDTTICRGESATLKVTISGVSNPQITWYSSTSVGAPVLATGDTYVTPILASSLNNYYIGVKGDGLCESLPANRKRVTVETNALATSGDITAYNASLCVGDNATLTASVTAVINPVFQWYTDNVSLVPIHVGATFTHNSVLKDTAFYVSVKGDGYCENLPANRKKISISVTGYSGHSINSVHPTFGVSNGSISVDFGTFKGIKYKFNNTGAWVTVTNLNNPITFANLAEGNYRFQIDAGGCNDLDIIITLKSKVIAIDDVITVFKGTTLNIPISSNDSDPGRTQLRDSILTAPGKGTAVLTEPRDGSLVYANNGQLGVDSVRYILKSLFDSDEAKVTIYIVDKTEIILVDSCSFAPYMLLSRTYAGAIYTWEFSDDNGATWADLGISEAKCPAVNAGRYRVKIRVGNAELITDYKNLAIINITNLLNKVWYEVGFN